MLGLVICNKKEGFLKVLTKHFDDLVERKAMKKLDSNIYEIDFLGSILAYEQRKPSEFEIRQTIKRYSLEIEKENISQNCMVLTGGLELLSTVYIHYEGLVREGLMNKTSEKNYEITKEGIDEMVKMFHMLGK